MPRPAICSGGIPPPAATRWLRSAPRRTSWWRRSTGPSAPTTRLRALPRRGWPALATFWRCGSSARDCSLRGGSMPWPAWHGTAWPPSIFRPRMLRSWPRGLRFPHRTRPCRHSPRKGKPCTRWAASRTSEGRSGRLSPGSTGRPPPRARGRPRDPRLLVRSSPPPIRRWCLRVIDRWITRSRSPAWPCSTCAPADFSAFLNAYAAGSPEANCDGSTIPPVLNVNDFACFLNAYAIGCP